MMLPQELLDVDRNVVERRMSPDFGPRGRLDSLGFQICGRMEGKLHMVADGPLYSERGAKREWWRGYVWGFLVAGVSAYLTHMQHANYRSALLTLCSVGVVAAFVQLIESTTLRRWYRSRPLSAEDARDG